ncbi:lytic transglycosylase domain-containing protein [Williamwhitmania taraxaci]|uniref:Membrane-bound lytic murein transglycosylase D n=1 Tax=Williamwhitmania taraxaci TaxID=1640674 RepID=A0A1G6LC15_9BACT|nr:lytic transglycosylase domain-containing protein [Williamwhitmania taraxaci]SDC40751.1 membrane-bound lytic murein transglycosylase D [Williamwhitmania taraxaci]
MGISKTFIVIAITFIFGVINSSAQSIGSRLVALSTEKHKPTIPVDKDNNIDSLLTLYYQQQLYDTTNIVTDYVVEGDSLNLELPDSVYIHRLQNIISPIELSFNGVVKSYIKVYTQRQKVKMEEILGLSDYYFPMFEEILDSYNMPLELRMLAVIESALNPNAVSRMGATGLWQFMYGTGRQYKLEVNSFVDARKDPVAATHAACRFLGDLYKIYGDWTLAIAAYNCGPGNVNKAIRRSGGKRDYWAIYYYLPRETRGYVPAFIAATYAYTYYKEHRLVPQNIDMPFAVDTIMVNKMMHFQQISEVLNVPVETLRQLNPQYRRDIVPAKNKEYRLTVPQVLVSRFVENEDAIYNYKDSVFFSAKFLSVPGNFDRDIDNVPGRKRITYRVKSGDNLGAIAEKFSVRVSDLRQWNHVRGSNIRAGQKLVVFVTKRVAQSSVSDLN